jgi:hypothetical protein
MEDLISGAEPLGSMPYGSLCTQNEKPSYGSHLKEIFIITSIIFATSLSHVCLN